MGVDKIISECIPHCYSPDKDGYGKMSVDYKKVYVHRWIYCRHNKLKLEDIAGKIVRHTCDNTSCINPEHLILGSHQDNVADRVARNRSFSPAGELHPRRKLTTDQVAEIRVLLSKPGSRYKVIAKVYGISEKAVGNIFNHVSWKD
jgi:hypothetical protein